MSPAVVATADGYQMLYRRVVAREGDPGRQSEYADRSVIAFASSADGLRFAARQTPVLTLPQEGAAVGLEDPTIVRDGRDYVVFYTGWSGWQVGIAWLLWARGPSLESLAPQGIAAAPMPPERFVKEAEVLPAERGVWMWREVDEIDRHERSRIALAQAPRITGPWRDHVVIAGPRADHWDAVNVSTGPLVRRGDRLLMLYNGMVRTDDPEFVHAARVGLMELDVATGRPVARSRRPVLEPPPGRRIAFAASVAGGRLYYTVDDAEIWVADLDLDAVDAIPMDSELEATALSGPERELR
jgi:predicted GH43/DUF377 family glycosyl hydrolase